MPKKRMDAWIKYLNSKGVEFDIGIPEAQLKLYDNGANGLFREINDNGNIRRIIVLKENPTVSTFYEECYHALQSLDNYPERGTIYDNVDLWEYDAKVRIVEEAEKLRVSPKEVEQLNYHIELVLKNMYGNY